MREKIHRGYRGKLTQEDYPINKDWDNLIGQGHSNKNEIKSLKFRGLISDMQIKDSLNSDNEMT